MAKKSFWNRKIMPTVTGSGVRKAKKWFKKKFDDITTVKGKRNAVTKPEIGKMYAYVYDAKWKAILPVWDRQPLVIPVNLYNDGFLGLNFHYLPVTQRYRLLSALNTVATPLTIQTLQMMKKQGFISDLESQLSGDIDDTEKRLILTWEIVKRVANAKHYKPTVHRYLYSHLRTQLSFVPSREWKIMLPLPTAKWVGKRPY